MMHMLSCFKLQPGASLEEFNSHLEAFSQHLQELGLVEGHSPVGRRITDTILDTDEERDQDLYMLMHFCDKAQSDRAVEYIESETEPGSTIHRVMWAGMRDGIFICWEDC